LKVIEGGNEAVAPVQAEILPAPPDGVPETMHAEWNAVLADLKERRLLNNSMLGVVRSYVMAQHTAALAEKSIAEQGVFVSGAGGAMKPNPATGLLRSSRDMISRLAGELGLTPTSRSRKSLQPAPGQNDLFGNEFDL
jgi:P27 family predicted phage terminase small subunit